MSMVEQNEYGGAKSDDIFVSGLEWKPRNL